LERYTHYVPIPGAILKNLLAHYLVKRFANKCDAIITPTSSTEEYLRHLGVSAIVETIPTGINIREYENFSTREINEFRSQYASENDLLLLSVSRMAREKNLDFLIDGLKKVSQNTKIPFKCLLVGDGPEKARLEKKVTLLDMDDRIFFTGGLDPHKVVGCYLASDIFVFASTSETQGMVLLEAMAGGCPVVAISSSGVYDVVEDGYNGFKVPESTDNWAEAVTSLMEDQELLRNLSQNSRNFAEKYSVENITEKVLRLYARVLVLRKATPGSKQQ
jgi:glycosyltransferase involved in cell wall biosynthesis